MTIPDAAINAAAEAMRGPLPTPAPDLDDVYVWAPVKTLSRAALAAALPHLLAAAWDEGYRSGHSNAMRRMSDEPDAPTTPNPYQAEATS